MIVECKRCFKEFTAPPSDRAKFCSYTCYWGPKIEKECLECRNLFRVAISRQHTAKFCSRQCKGMYRSKHLVGPKATAWKGGITHDDRGYLQISHGEHVKKRLHRVRAEKALGKPLPPKAVVHHANGDVENPNAQLVICEDQGYHLLLHKLARQRKRG